MSAENLSGKKSKFDVSPPNLGVGNAEIKKIPASGDDYEEYDGPIEFLIDDEDKVVVDPEYAASLKEFKKDKVIIDGGYQKQINEEALGKRKAQGTIEKTDKEKSVIDDRLYPFSPQRHQGKVSIDAGYKEDIRKESPEDFIPELSPDLLEEIHEGPERKMATAYEQNVRAIMAESELELAKLRSSREEQLERMSQNTKFLSVEKFELETIDQDIVQTEEKREKRLQEARGSFERRVFEVAEPYEVDPERLAAAARRYDAARTSIEDDYEGDVADARAEFNEVYKVWAKNGLKTEDSSRSRVRELRRMIEVNLPNFRDERLRQAEQEYLETVTASPFDQELFCLTASFEKKTSRIEAHIAGIQKDMEKLKNFPDIIMLYRQQINALNQEARYVAQDYSREVEALKKDHELARKSASSVERSLKKSERAKETMPVIESAFLHAGEVEKILADFGQKTAALEASAEEEEYEVELGAEILLLDNKKQGQLETARVDLEKVLFDTEEEDGMGAEDVRFAQEHYRENVKKVTSEYEEKTTAALKEFSSLKERLDTTQSARPEDVAARQRLAELRHEIDVRLVSERSTGLYKALKTYENAMTRTPFEKELFAATVAFEREAGRVNEEKTTINDILSVLVKENLDKATWEFYRDELRRLDEKMKTVAKKFSEEVEILKKEQHILNQTVARPETQSAKNALKKENQNHFPKVA